MATIVPSPGSLSMVKLLPLAERTALASVPGVASVCGMRWFGGRLDRSQEQFPSMACERESFPQVFDIRPVGVRAIAVRADAIRVYDARCGRGGVGDFHPLEPSAAT